MKTKLIIALGAAILTSACATGNPGLYQWGSYEHQIYAMYAEGGKTSPQEQIGKLESDLEKARAANRPLPPGFQAHLGYLYYQTGKLDQALAAFEAEKLLFPESRPYMDRLITQSKR
jgi:hypothetical protein